MTNILQMLLQMPSHTIGEIRTIIDLSQDMPTVQEYFKNELVRRLSEVRDMVWQLHNSNLHPRELSPIQILDCLNYAVQVEKYGDLIDLLDQHYQLHFGQSYFDLDFEEEEKISPVNWQKEGF